MTTTLMDPSKWRRRFVYCRGAYLAVYQFYSIAAEEAQRQDAAQRDVVLLIAGCANSVAVYTMLGDRSLPDFLFSGGYDVWAMDVRGHGEVFLNSEWKS